jgi:CTP:molybdopterin cytidylyltransferase MocA
VSVAGLILAAGESRRMGFPKALLRYRDETFLDTLIGLFAARCQPVIVVLGAHAGLIREGTRRPATFATNADYQRGQTSSMQCGLRAVPPTAESVLFTLVDHPAVAPATLDALLAGPGPRDAVLQATHSLTLGALIGAPTVREGLPLAVQRHPDEDLRGAGPLVRVPRYQGRRGHPIWFSRQLIAGFLDLPELGAARDIVRSHAAQTEFLDVDDAGILADIDDAEAYGRLTGASL